jgi:hypothetical protein
MRVRRKPLELEAEQWQGWNADPVSGVEQIPGDGPIGSCRYCSLSYIRHGWIVTLEGGHIVCPGDWIMTGVKGEKYPCKPDIFERIYEKVD